MKRRIIRGTAAGGLALVVAVALASCSALEPRPDGSRYFLLRAEAEPAGDALADVVLGLGPVTVPDYLDRIEMLDLVGPYELSYSQRNRWVEPLGTQVRQVLLENLRSLLRPDAVVAWPWYATEGVDLAVEVALDAIRLDADGTWRGSVEWAVRGPASAPALERDGFILELGRDSIPPEEIAGALSSELERLSDEIAAAVRRQAGR